MTTPTPPDVAWTPLSGPTRQIALEVLLDGPLSRSDLAQRIGLSPGSLTRLTKPLLDSGLLVEADPDTTPPSAGGAPRLGRPAQPLDVAAASHHFIGIKLTGDHAYAALTDLRADILAADDAPLPSHAPDDVIETVALLVDRLVDRLETLRPGIHLCPGGRR